jgi:hypothetical protein
MNASEIKLEQIVNTKIIRNRGIPTPIDLSGKFHLEHWRDGKLLSSQEVFNGVTDEGKKKILDLYFYYTDTEVPDDVTYGVYIGLINTGASLAAADTYTTHAGWTEYTNYKVSASDYRGKWTTGAASGSGTVSITNGTAITYDIDGAGGTIYGIFVVSGTITEIRTQSDVTAGNKLWATGALASELAVVSGDQLKITYTVNC